MYFAAVLTAGYKVIFSCTFLNQHQSNLQILPVIYHLLQPMDGRSACTALIYNRLYPSWMQSKPVDSLIQQCRVSLFSLENLACDATQEKKKLSPTHSFWQQRLQLPVWSHTALLLQLIIFGKQMILLQLLTPFNLLPDLWGEARASGTFVPTLSPLSF